MLIYHVSHLEDGDLAKDMLEEQVSNNWPGLAREVDKLVEMLRIEDPKREKLGLGDGTRSLYSSTATVSCFYDYVSTIYLIVDLMKVHRPERSHCYTVGEVNVHKSYTRSN